MLTISDNSNDKDLLNDLKSEFIKIEKNLTKLYLETLLTGKAHSNNSLVEIHSGAGGVESQDWVAILFRMYNSCLLYTSPSPRDRQKSRMPSSA